MRLIVDTDTAGDDVFSLMIALTRPGVSVEAITIAHGNVGFAQHAENALATLEACGRGGEVPVYLGAARPLSRTPLAASYVFGADGMSDSGFPRAAQRPAPGEAADQIVRRIMAEPGEITLLAQAPLTNLALAVMMEPRIAQACRHLWIMGGTDNGVGNVTPAAEYNLYVDPEAAKIVLGAGFDVSIVTWTETLRDGLLTLDQLGELAALETPRSRFFMAVNRASLAFAQKTQGLGGSLHPDALTCALALDEALILDAEMCAVDVETKGELTRGYLSVSHPILPDAELADPDLPGKPPNARVIKSADRAGFFAAMKAALV
ncbi:MAG: nucleoside hydrolase [Phenylobacterium sp. RIFCSPHIGHO2_01_FULL_69_31]|jgi:purine nucleosidase|uniref:nucleoside hydrolase n=1 Tax=Phenylobacterium sp. RIFCSPHIGHO2_01_FULL_69_31 TaxID=1801944 RepID=UPI0008B70BF9|nr:nucleoside hydrolase [Phenylobacterium sp. RIFCSPHIGHO2_01_FULL_69_31]OHB28054.1 MAG: nucleoside hydrolase [Phenylobacterium sp. RIFCSPHIGHO2_01_FULL_69_31]